MADTENGITPTLTVESASEGIPAKTHPVVVHEQEPLLTQRPVPIDEMMKRQGIAGFQGLAAFADPEWELDEESERFLEAIFAESDSASSGASAGPRQTVS